MQQFINYALFAAIALLVIMLLPTLGTYRRKLFGSVLSAIESGRFQVSKAKASVDADVYRLMTAHCKVDENLVVIVSHAAGTNRPRFTLDVHEGGIRAAYSYGMGCTHSKLDEPRLAAAFTKVWLKGGRS